MSYFIETILTPKPIVHEIYVHSFIFQFFNLPTVTYLSLHDVFASKPQRQNLRGVRQRLSHLIVPAPRLPRISSSPISTGNGDDMIRVVLTIPTNTWTVITIFIAVHQAALPRG